MPDPDVCRRCAESGPTCCCLDPGEEESCFPLSAVEKDKILECRRGQGAFAQEANSQVFLDNMKKLFPKEKKLIDALFPERKFHLRLATGPDGRCKLLGREGCVLPGAARPYYCRLFPFWVLGRRISIFTSSRCLAQREAKALKGLLASLETTEAGVSDLHAKLRLAWGLPPGEGSSLVKHAFRRKTG